MPLYENVARSLVREQETQLRAMTPEGRAAHVRNVTRALSEKTEDELITFMSSRKGRVSPVVSEQIEDIKQRKPQGVVDIGEEEFEATLPELEHVAELQKLGVDTDRPLPAGSLEIGFGVDPVESLTGALSEHFGEPVTVFQRGEDILYIDPTDQVVAVAKKGTAAMVGQALPIAGDVAGTIGGGVAAGAVTKSPAGVVAGEAIGSGVGTFTGEYLRLLVGKGLGVHTLSQEDMLKRASKQGAVASIATGVTGGVIAGGKGIVNFFKGRVFTKEAALKHGLSSDEADIVIDEVNRILAGKGEVKGTLFTRTGDPVVGATEAEVRQNIKHAGDFIERDIADQKALTEALDTVTKPTPAKGGEAMQEVIQQQVTKRVTQAKAVVAKNVDEFEKQLSTISKTAKEEVGRPTRALITEKSAAEKQAVTAQWDEVKEIGGFNPKTETFGITIGRGPETLRRKAILERRAKAAGTQTEKAGAGVFTKKPKAQDLEDFNKELSGLKKKKRALEKGKEFTDQDSKAMGDVIAAMEADRKIILIKAGKQDLLEQIEKAEVATAKFHKKFNRSVVGDLTAKNEKGVFKIKEKDFVDKTLKGSGDEAEQLLDVIGSTPTVMNQWKEGIADAYKRDVIDKIGVFKGAKPDITQRKQLIKRTTDWITQRRDVLEKFFTKTELSQIEKTGDLAVLVKKQIAQQEQIIKNAKKFGKGKLASLDPSELVKFVTGKSGGFATKAGGGIEAPLSKIRFVKNATKNHPGAWKAFQEEFSTSIRKNLVDPETSKITPKKISDLLKNQSDEVSEIMGEQYLKDLRSINKVTQILKVRPKTLGGDEVNAAVIQAVRGGAAPPLTRRGRLFTAWLLFDRKRAHDVVAKALLDPSTMSKVAKLAEHKTVTREAAELAVSLGFITEE